MEAEEFIPVSFAANDTDVLTVVRFRARSRTAGLTRRPGRPAPLLGLDPAEQVLLADRLEQRGMVGGHMAADHPDDLVIAVAPGHVPALAPDELHRRASLPLPWLCAQRSARILG
jgi:hypothetical protein